MLWFIALYVDPPVITTVEVTGRCTNDFTLSWATASNEEGLSYTVSIVSDEISEDVMDTTYNVTELTPGTTYTISVNTRLTTTSFTPCLGFPNITNTTLTVEAGVPRSELIVVMHCSYLWSVCIKLIVHI